MPNERGEPKPKHSDYDFRPTPAPPSKPSSIFTVNEQLLIDAGNSISVRSLATGKVHRILQEAARAHAQYQADRGIQGHQLWDRRVDKLFRDLPEYNSFRECAAESWPDEDAKTAAAEMYKSWRQSSGHWKAINGRCDIWGYSMAFNEDKGIWYACAIFADRRPNTRRKAGDSQPEAAG